MPVLREVVRFDNAELVAECIKKGAEVNAPDEEDGNTALHNAVFRGTLEAARVLLIHNANPHILNKKNLKPIQCFSDDPQKIKEDLEHNKRLFEGWSTVSNNHVSTTRAEEINSRKTEYYNKMSELTNQLKKIENLQSKFLELFDNNSGKLDVGQNTYNEEREGSDVTQQEVPEAERVLDSTEKGAPVYQAHLISTIQEEEGGNPSVESVEQAFRGFWKGFDDPDAGSNLVGGMDASSDNPLLLKNS